MATRAPLNLGQRGFSYGFRTPPYMPQTTGGDDLASLLQQAQGQGPPDDQRRQARNYALQDVLSNQPTIESGSVAEALAEALAGGLRGRALMGERERELSAASRAEALEQMQADRDYKGDIQDRDLRAQMLAQSQQPDYQVDDFGRPYTIQGGQVQYGEGRVNVRQPGSGAGGRAPPAGYRYTPDGNLQPIPGGPADLRATEAGQSRLAQMDSSARSLQNAIDVLRNAESQVTGSTAGLGGQLLRGVGGTEAYDLNQALEPVRAILSFENLQEMRRNSQTGGALGSIAVRELELLGSTVRSLDTAQSPAALRRAILETRAQLERTQAAIQAARSEMGAAPQASGQQGTGRLRYNPETGDFE